MNTTNLRSLKDFLEIPYEKLEEMNLKAKDRAGARVRRRLKEYRRSSKRNASRQ